jgi:hypothetical protein
MSDRGWEEFTRADRTKTFALDREHGVELVLVHDEEPQSGRRWCAIELWTARSVYSIDVDRVCIGVRSRESERDDPRHRLLGSRLVGGQHQEGAGLSISQPLPLPGMDAALEIGSGPGSHIATTSKVERVVVRVRMATIPLDADRPADGAAEPPISGVWRQTFGR